MTSHHQMPQGVAQNVRVTVRLIPQGPKLVSRLVIDENQEKPPASKRKTVSR